ncbi:MAG: PqqD family peptide modification chaperone [Candidatus Bathyarchaeota archaeon]
MRELLPCAPSNLVFRKMRAFYIVLNPDMPNIMVVDSIGREILKLCDGKTKVDHIVNHVLATSPDKARREDIKHFIRSLADSGFITTGESPPMARQNQPIKKLVLLHLHLTRACNFRCKHCYARAGKPHKAELSDTDILSVITQFADLEGEQLTLSGGEPLLRRELLHQIVKNANGWGIERVYIETNGTLITAEDAKIFKETGTTVTVSLDGATPETCNHIRGRYAFEKATEGIRTLVRSQVNTGIGITFMSHNLKEAEEIVRLAKRLKVNFLSLNSIRIIGRAEENPDLAVPMNDATRAIIKAWRTARKLKVRTSFEKQIEQLKSLSKAHGCGAGTSDLTITADGNVYPCNMLQRPEFVAGNIKTQSLGEIWKTSSIMELFQEMSVLDIPKCRSCELKYMCRGCPADSYLTYGNLMQTPPSCALYRKICWVTIKELARQMWLEA